MTTRTKVCFVGTLTRHPQLDYTPVKRTAVARLALAVRYHPYHHRTADKDERVLCTDVVIRGPQAVTSGRYLRKGRLVLIEGYVEWQHSIATQDGQHYTKYAVRAEWIAFLSTAAEESAAPDDSDEDVPF